MRASEKMIRRAEPLTPSRYLRSRRKRALDLALGGLALVLASPALAVAAVAIRLETHGHAIFRQRRVGLHGRPFLLFKLRTMVTGCDRAASAEPSQEALSNTSVSVSKSTVARSRAIASRQ